MCASVCRSIVELHGGKVWVSSDGEGQGSTFTLELPVFYSTQLNSDAEDEDEFKTSVALDVRNNDELFDETARADSYRNKKTLFTVVAYVI